MASTHKSSARFLRRYTDLPSLMHLLEHKALTLLDPESWDDKNDSAYMRYYKDKAGLQSLLALCFTEAAETYHHWKVFSPGPAGVCIVFRREALEAVSAFDPDVALKKVRYLRLDEGRASALKQDQLLYSKRIGFAPESEVRMVYRSAVRAVRSVDLPIKVGSIDRIYLSPWLHPNLRDSVKKQIKAIKGCRSLKVYRSTLTSNTAWRKLGEAAI